MSRMCPAARPTSGTPNGSSICWHTVSSERVSCPTPRRRSCGHCCARASNSSERRQADALEAAIAEIDQKVEADIEPFRAAVKQLSSIPGVKALGGQVIVSEIGIDMSRFPSDGHLVSWAGICPRNDESAGKRRSNRLRKGAPWLKTMLVQCAWSAVRQKDTYLRAQFYHVKARRGPKKAIMAGAPSVLTAAYPMLKDGKKYQDLGPNHVQRRNKDQQKHLLLKRLADLGYAAALTPLAV